MSESKIGNDGLTDEERTVLSDKFAAAQSIDVRATMARIKVRRKSEAMKGQALEARVQAHCQSLSADVASYRPDQIRNRLAYIVANAEALAELREAD